MVTWQQIENAVATLSDNRIQSVELFDIIVDRVSRTGVRVWRFLLAQGCESSDDQAIQELVDQVVRVLRNNADAEEG